MMQQFGDSDQQLQINGVLVQNLVHISPISMYRLGKPRDGSALCFQLGPDHISYV